MNKIYSNQEELNKLETILVGYLKLPFTEDTIPGSLMENVLATVRQGVVLNTYDFVDVVNKNEKIGWQVKSTKDTTPVTWKRAKIANSQSLINESFNSDKALSILGNEIIRFCNDHAEESLRLYNLDAIGYSRLIVHKNNRISYFERLLCTKENPIIFNEDDFIWHWSTPKVTIKKEQLPALHGINKKNNKKWFAWHGLGENQLHFSGEKEWWPTDGSLKTFDFPSSKLNRSELMNLLENLSKLT
ncbi:hypothetical protein [Providencia sp. PROV141]|uniref:hypothetical protein n=1 Tax=Providencia sp. PROV141 TaxID=2949851 RepID=UPI00234A8838|nr:hypothetical protein [Providencia sp. PROV141]